MRLLSLATPISKEDFRVLDRIEDRLYESIEGLHLVGEAASEEDLRRSGLPEGFWSLWQHWDGMSLLNAELRISSAAEIADASDEARGAGLIGPEDHVIGEYGTILLVVPADPWEEGADVVAVEEDGQRSPFASTVPKLVLGVMAELAVLYDEWGEARDRLFGEDGELRPNAERRFLRRRLDFDPDAPFPRYRLAQLLRRNGEEVAARRELDLVLRRAPNFAWAHFERGRVLAHLGDQSKMAKKAFASAAELVEDEGMRAYMLAWEASVSEGEERERLVSAVSKLYPEFANSQERGAREALEDGDPLHARECLRLGLVLAPAHLGLLSLRADVEQAAERFEVVLDDERRQIREAEARQREDRERQKAEAQAAKQSASESGANEKRGGKERRDRKRGR